MNENSFYIAQYNSGLIDRKINLSQRDLTLAFSTGRFYGYKEGEIRIFKIDLDAVSVIEIPVSEILERIEKSREKREEKEEKDRKKEIARKIAELQAQREDGGYNYVWVYVNSFGTQGEADQYFNKSCDIETIR